MTILCSSKIKLQSKLFNADTQYPKILRQVSFPKNRGLEENWTVKDETSAKHEFQVLQLQSLEKKQNSSMDLGTNMDLELS